MRSVTFGQNKDLPRSGVGKLRPLSQISPAACFRKWSFTGLQVCLLINILYVAAFTLQRKTWVIVTETILRAKPKVFTHWAFTRKVYRTRPRSCCLFWWEIVDVGLFHVISWRQRFTTKLLDFLNRDILEKNFMYVLDWK